MLQVFFCINVWYTKAKHFLYCYVVIFIPTRMNAHTLKEILTWTIRCTELDVKLTYSSTRSDEYLVYQQIELKNLISNRHNVHMKYVMECHFIPCYLMWDKKKNIVFRVLISNFKKCVNLLSIFCYFFYFQSDYNHYL